MEERGRGFRRRPSFRQVRHPAYRSPFRPHRPESPPCAITCAPQGVSNPQDRSRTHAGRRKLVFEMTANPHSTGPNAELAVSETGRGTVVVAIRGELARDGVLDRLRSAVHRRCEDDGVNEVHVDLRQTTAIDLQGLGALLTLRRECRERGARFVVDNPTGPVRSRLEQSGTLEYLRGGR